MGNIIDYVLEESQDFLTKGFSEVDSLVLAQLSYLDFADRVDGWVENAVHHKTLGELFSGSGAEETAQGTRTVELNRALAVVLAQSPRFGSVGMGYYWDVFDEERQEQFAAITFFLPDGTAYVAFRGTNGTLVGWKEDFNMTYMMSVPAQRDGLCYLNQIAGQLDAPLRLGGHSKGGNVAVYAAMSCEKKLQERILAVYNHDGPGFREEVLQCEGFERIQERVFKTMPCSSLIGMLLTSRVHYTVVNSTSSGMQQHDPFSWVVDGGAFSCAESLTRGARIRGEIVNTWVSEYSDEKRALFVNTFYEAIVATRVDTLGELSNERLKSAMAVIQNMNEVDDETKHFVIQTLRALLSHSMREVLQSLPKMRRDDKAQKQGKRWAKFHMKINKYSVKGRGKRLRVQVRAIILPRPKK